MCTAAGAPPSRPAPADPPCAAPAPAPRCPASTARAPPGAARVEAAAGAEPSAYDDPTLAAAAAASRGGQREAVLAALAALLLDAESTSGSEAETPGRAAAGSSSGYASGRSSCALSERAADLEPAPRRRSPGAGAARPAGAAHAPPTRARAPEAPSCMDGPSQVADADGGRQPERTRASAALLADAELAAAAARAAAAPDPLARLASPSVQTGGASDGGGGGGEGPTITAAQLRGCLSGWVADAVAAHLAAAAAARARAPPAAAPRAGAADAACQAGAPTPGARAPSGTPDGACERGPADLGTAAPREPCAGGAGAGAGRGAEAGACSAEAVTALAREAAAAELARLIGAWDGALGTLPDALRALAGSPGLHPEGSHKGSPGSAARLAAMRHAPAAAEPGAAAGEETPGHASALAGVAPCAAVGPNPTLPYPGPLGGGHALVQLVLRTLAEVALEELRRRGQPAPLPSALTRSSEGPDAAGQRASAGAAAGAGAGVAPAAAPRSPRDGRPRAVSPLELLKQRRSAAAGGGQGSPAELRQAECAAPDAAAARVAPGERLPGAFAQHDVTPALANARSAAAGTTEVGTSTSGLRAPPAATPGPGGAPSMPATATGQHAPARQAPHAGADHTCSGPHGGGSPVGQAPARSSPASRPPATASSPAQGAPVPPAFGAHQAFYLVPAGAYLGAAAPLAADPNSAAAAPMQPGARSAARAPEAAPALGRLRHAAAAGGGAARGDGGRAFAPGACIPPVRQVSACTHRTQTGLCRLRCRVMKTAPGSLLLSGRAVMQRCSLPHFGRNGAPAVLLFTGPACPANGPRPPGPARAAARAGAGTGRG